MQTQKLINDILTKVINPIEISKGSVNNLFVINVVSENPFTHTSIIYRSETLRDEAYILLDDTTFWSLSFNPNYLSTL